MKFLCDQCKAKYQISDDKVAGKTVRMKCRKCGHQIEVRAAVTETSVSSSLPQSDAPAGMGGGGGAVGSIRPSAAPQAPRAQASGGGPRPGGLATSLSAARPAAPRVSVHPPQGNAGGALAGAFRSSVKEGDDPVAGLEMLDMSSTDEWYCAINGVPVGPIRMTELRRKAALGAVTEESLVWQEGLEEWRAAKTIPELTAIIREAQATGRPSLVTPQPPDAIGNRTSAPPPAPTASMRPGTMRSSPAAPRATEPPRPAPFAPQTGLASAQASAARNNVVPITSRLATAEKLQEESHAPGEMALERFSVASDPFASPPAASSMQSGSAMIGSTLSFPPAAAIPSAVATASLPAPIESRRSSSPPPWIIIAMLVLAAAFGITAAIGIFFNKQQPAPAPQPVVIQMPAAPQPLQPAVAAAAVPTPADSSSAAAAGSAGKPGASGKPGAIAAAKPGASAGAKGVDPSVANLLNGIGGGPSTGGPGGGGGGGGSLTADQVEGVVRNHSLGVRRSCWERGASASPSANITVSVSVGGTGNVTNASATGNDPAVAKCIEGAVKSWQFPATGGNTTVNIPFHFVRQ